MQITLLKYKHPEWKDYQKIQVIKHIRAATGVGLKEAKEMSDLFQAYQPIVLTLGPLWMRDHYQYTVDDVVRIFEEDFGITVLRGEAQLTDDCEAFTLLRWGDHAVAMPKERVEILTWFLRAATGEDVIDINHIEAFHLGSVLHFDYFSCPEFPTLTSIVDFMDDRHLVYTTDYKPMSRMSLLFDD